MYIIVILLALVLIAVLILRDWVYKPRISSHFVQKTLKAASHHALLGSWKEVKTLLTPLLEKGYEDKDISLLHIKMLHKTGALKEAYQEVQKAAKYYPEELVFRMEEGLILLNMEKPREALEAFKVCAPIMRGESDALALAAALHRGGYPTQSFELLEPWLSHTQNGELLALAGDTFFENKEFQQAIDYYYQAIEKGYKTHLVTTQLAHAYRRLGNLTASEKIFQNLLEKDPSDLIATLGFGACMQERGHYQKALLIYQSSGSWDKKDPRLMKEAGLCALKTRKYSYAELYFFEILQIDQSDPLCFAYYALTLEHQDKWQEAEQVYTKLIQIFPSYPQGYRALAWMFGVGLTCTLSQQQGTNFAYIALKLNNDRVSWEILSACEARVGNFERAYQIQTSLETKEETKEERIRRQQSLRSLRKNHPLDGHHVIRSLVA